MARDRTIVVDGVEYASIEISDFALGHLIQYMVQRDTFTWSEIAQCIEEYENRLRAAERMRETVSPMMRRERRGR